MTFNRTTAVKFLLWLGSVILAAFVGAWIDAYLARPRLAIEVMAPSIADVVPEEESDQQEVSPSVQILEDCGKGLWMPCFRKQQNLREYLRQLKFDAAQGTARLDQLTTLRNAMDRWPKEIKDRNSLDAVYELLRANTEIVMNAIFYETLQGNRTFHTSGAAHRRVPSPYYVIKKDDEGDLFVFSGNRMLPILWTRYLPQISKGELKATADRLASAIAYGSRDDLNDLRAALDRILGSESTARDHQAHVEAELRAYSHWTIKAVFTNSGKEPISLSAKSALYVKTHGQTFKDQEGVQRSMTGDYVIEMSNTESGGALNFNRTGGETNFSMFGAPVNVPSDDPIGVEGGHAVTATFRSVTRVREMENSPVILDWYKTSNLTCVLGVLPITSNVSQFAALKPVWSAPVAFNGASFREMFPKEVDWK